MSWQDAWDRMASNKQFPWAPAEPEGDWRVGVGLVAIGISVCGLIASVVGIFVHGYSIAGWGMAAAFAGAAVTGLCFRGKRKS